MSPGTNRLKLARVAFPVSAAPNAHMASEDQINNWDNLDAPVKDRLLSMHDHKTYLQKEQTQIQSKPFLLSKHRNLLLNTTKIMESKLEVLVENEKSRLIEYFDDQLVQDKKRDKENDMNQTNVALHAQVSRSKKSRSVSFDTKTLYKQYRSPNSGEWLDTTQKLFQQTVPVSHFNNNLLQCKQHINKSSSDTQISDDQNNTTISPNNSRSTLTATCKHFHKPSEKMFSHCSNKNMSYFLKNNTEDCSEIMQNNSKSSLKSNPDILQHRIDSLENEVVSLQDEIRSKNRFIDQLQKQVTANKENEPYLTNRAKKLAENTLQLSRLQRHKLQQNQRG